MRVHKALSHIFQFGYSEGYFSTCHNHLGIEWCSLILLQPASCGPAEDRLIATVLKGYNALSRPEVEGGGPVDVWFGMGLIQILQIVEVEQTVKANVWLRLVW